MIWVVVGYNNALREYNFLKDEKILIASDIDDPKKLFKMFKSDYKEVYECVIRDNKNLDYIVLMLKQKFDS